MLHARALGLPLALALAALLVGCGQTPTPPLPEPVDREAATFSIRLGASPLELTIDETASVPITVTRTVGFEGGVTVGPAPAAPPPAGLSVGGATVPSGGTVGALDVSVDDRVAPGTYRVPLLANSGDVAKVVVLVVHVRAPLARVDAAFVEGSGGSREVRQGQGSVVLVLQGAHFDRVAAFELAGAALPVAPGRSDAEVRLEVVVGHGAELGPRTLRTVTTGYGAADVEAALTVTPVVAGPTGDDDAGRGTEDAPFRTLGRALTAAGPGDSVFLHDGRYDAAAGEAWPFQYWDATFAPIPLPDANVPEGVTVRGASREGVVLAGAYLFGDASVALVFAGGGRLERLTLEGFATAVVAHTGRVVVDDVTLLENGEGLVVLGDAELDFTRAFVQGTFHDAVHALGDARVRVFDTLLDANLWGATASGNAQLELDTVWIASSGLEGLRVRHGASALVRGSVIEGSALAGVRMAGRSLVVRDTELRGNGASGLLVEEDPDQVDFGTLLDPGGNTFVHNLPYQVHDARPSRDDLFGVPVTFSATTLQGAAPPPSIEAGPTAVGDLYWVEGTNQRLEFY
jgi:hypothetical protein